MEIIPGALYRHVRKGSLYRLLTVAQHTEREERLVVYNDTEPESVAVRDWARPYDMFGDGRFQLEVESPTVHIASKTLHAKRWRSLRALGLPIISTWIDSTWASRSSAREAVDYPLLWDSRVDEARRATFTVVYREPGEVLKGAFVEAGVALANDRAVYFIGDTDGVGSWLQHRNVRVVLVTGSPPWSVGAVVSRVLRGVGE